MPGTSAWEQSEARFRPSERVAVVVPTAVAFVVQVVSVAAIAAWLRLPPVITLIGLALAAASALALLGSGRWPGPTVAVVAALTTIDLLAPPEPGPPFIALAFAIIGAVVRGARVWALVSVGTAWFAAIIVGGLLGVVWHPFRIALTTLGLAVCFAIGAGIRARFEHGAARRAQLAERRRTAEQDERNRIARELHDVVAHSLSQISVQAGVGLHLFDREPERAREALANIRGLSATGLDEVRGALSFLRGDSPGAPATAPLTPQPQLAELPQLVEQRTGLGLTVTLDDRLAGAVPPGVVQTTAYRIAQEALTNVVRHSVATRAVVTLERVADDLVVSIADDGAGRPPGAGEGGGIRGMRERASLVDGTLEIAPGDGSGTVVTARLPWDGPR